MIYSVSNSNLLLIWGWNSAINKASLILNGWYAIKPKQSTNQPSLILRWPTLRTIASIFMEWLSLFLHLIKYLWNEDARVLRCSLILMWRGSDCTSYKENQPLKISLCFSNQHFHSVPKQITLEIKLNEFTLDAAKKKTKLHILHTL